MRSFAFALVAAAMATFGSAAPAGHPVGHLPPPPPHHPILRAAVPLARQVGVGQPPLHPAPFHPPPPSHPLHPGGPGPLARDGMPSIPVIYAGLNANINVYLTQLNGLDMTTCTVAEVTPIVDGINAELLIVLSEIMALSSLDAGIILASSAGMEMSVPDVTAIVDAEIEALLVAIGHALAVVDVSIEADIAAVFYILDATLSSLLSATFGLMPGAEAMASSALMPVQPIMSEVGMVSVAASLDIML